MALQRASLVLDAQKVWEGKSIESTEEKLLKYDETHTFPSLKACSTGKTPDTFAQFCEMLDEDIEKWIVEAAVTNPHWFPLEKDEAEEEKKRETTLITSTNG